MANVHIPDSMAEAIHSLTGLSALLKAKEWERAAIVYAFTIDQQGSNQHQRKVANALGINEFAGVGIAGLKTADTVRVYRNAWQSAIDDGQARPVEPGDDIELPTMPWPPTAHERGRIDMARASAPPEDKAQIIRQLIEEDPAVSEIVAAEPTVMRKLDAARAEREPRYLEPSPRQQQDFDGMVASAVARINVALIAERDGNWAPNADSELFLHMLGQLLRNRSDAEPRDNTDVFADIEKHLATAR